VVGNDADLRVFVAAVAGRADLPRRFTGQTFLCLALASCVSGTNGDRQTRSVDLAISTSLAILADFALLEDLLLQVALTLATPLTLSSSLEVTMTLAAPLTLTSLLGVALSLASSSINLLMTSQGMALLSPDAAEYVCERLPVGLSPMLLMPFSSTRTASFKSLSSARSS
jgi:hypothetical protein